MPCIPVVVYGPGPPSRSSCSKRENGVSLVGCPAPDHDERNRQNRHNSRVCGLMPGVRLEDFQDVLNRRDVFSDQQAQVRIAEDRVLMRRQLTTWRSRAAGHAWADAACVPAPDSLVAAQHDQDGSPGLARRVPREAPGSCTPSQSPAVSMDVHVRIHSGRRGSHSRLR
jgi:hypothetical protein